MDRKPLLPLHGTRAGGGYTNQDAAKAVLDLNERMKELECLHGIGRLVTAPGLPVEEVLEKAAALIAGSLQYPEKSAVRISIDGKTFISGIFTGPAGMISAPIYMNGDQSGEIEVSYPAGPENSSGYCILPEEKELINTIAGTLGRFLEYRYSIELLGKKEDLLGETGADLEIVESREYLSATFDSIGDAVIVTDIDGITTMINPAAESITGWKARDAAGQPVETVFRIMKENTGREINPLTSKIWRGGGPGIPDNLLLVSKEGQEIPVAANSTPIRDRAGNLTGVVLVFRDRSEEWLHQKIQNIRISLFEFSVSHTLNELLVRIIDEVEDITGSTIGFYHFIPVAGDTVSLRVWSTRTSGKHCSLTAKWDHYNISGAGVWADCIPAMEPVIYNDYNSLPHKKGYPEGHAFVYRLVTVPVVRNNRVVAVLGVGNKPSDYTARDAEILKYIADRTWEIAEKMHSEEEFKSKERQLHLLRRSVEQSPLSLFITDTEGKIEYVNRTFLNWSGYTFAELTGKTLRMLKPGNVPGSVHREIWKNLIAGGEWQGEHKNRRKNGETYWEKVHLSAVKNREGRIENFIALCEDITLQKQIESNLIAAKEKAEESDRLKSAFLANMSHEIRTPMNGILGFLQLLKRPDISDSNREQYISIVTESGNRLMNTINDIIEISQIEVGQMNILFSAVDLQELMDYLYGFFQTRSR
jgi:two-component system, sensor histidine kinase and response regulator